MHGRQRRSTLFLPCNIQLYGTCGVVRSEHSTPSPPMQQVAVRTPSFHSSNIQPIDCLECHVSLLIRIGLIGHHRRERPANVYRIRVEILELNQRHNFAVWPKHVVITYADPHLERSTLEAAPDAVWRACGAVGVRLGTPGRALVGFLGRVAIVMSAWVTASAPVFKSIC